MADIDPGETEMKERGGGEDGDGRTGQEETSLGGGGRDPDGDELLGDDGGYDTMTGGGPSMQGPMFDEHVARGRVLRRDGQFPLEYSMKNKNWMQDDIPRKYISKLMVLRDDVRETVAGGSVWKGELLSDLKNRENILGSVNAGRFRGAYGGKSRMLLSSLRVRYGTTGAPIGLDFTEGRPTRAGDVGEMSYKHVAKGYTKKRAATDAAGVMDSYKKLVYDAMEEYNKSLNAGVRRAAAPVRRPGGGAKTETVPKVDRSSQTTEEKKRISVSETQTPTTTQSTQDTQTPTTTHSTQDTQTPRKGLSVGETQTPKTTQSTQDTQTTPSGVGTASQTVDTAKKTLDRKTQTTNVGVDKTSQTAVTTKKTLDSKTQTTNVGVDKTSQTAVTTKKTLDSDTQTPGTNQTDKDTQTTSTGVDGASQTATKKTLDSDTQTPKSRLGTSDTVTDSIDPAVAERRSAMSQTDVTGDVVNQVRERSMDTLEERIREMEETFRDSWMDYRGVTREEQREVWGAFGRGILKQNFVDEVDGDGNVTKTSHELRMEMADIEIKHFKDEAAKAREDMIAAEEELKAALLGGDAEVIARAKDKVRILKSRMDMFQNAAEITGMAADYSRLMNGIAPLGAEALRIVDNEVDNSEELKLERVKRWFKKNWPEASVGAVSVAGLIVGIISATKGALKVAAGGIARFAAAVGRVFRKLGPIFAALGSVIMTALSWGAKGLAWLASNLWFLVVVVVAAVYSEYGRRKQASETRRTIEESRM